MVFKWTGIPVSIGIAPTKALAKIANRIAKKFPNQTKGVYLINSEQKRIKALKWLKIQDVWGGKWEQSIDLGQNIRWVTGHIVIYPYAQVGQ